MSAEPAVKMTEQEYPAYERRADDKSEFLNGELFASRWRCQRSMIRWISNK